MQKIQFYLVPNKITVTTDRVGFNTEYRQVYQRQLKLYKGIDNTIQLDVRNSEQRKQTVVGRTAIVKFFDTDHKNLFTATATAIPSQLGQMTLTIGSDTIADIDPQMLRMAAYLTDGTEQSAIYIDGQFELFGNVELKDGYNDKLGFGEIIDVAKVFNFEFDRNQFLSEMVTFGTYLNDDYSTALDSTVTGSVEIEVVPDVNDPFNGFVNVYATADKSTASSVSWKLIDSVEVTSASSVTKVIENSGYRYMRFGYTKSSSSSSATFDIEKLGSTYTILAIPDGGRQYDIGDKVKLLGTSLGGTSPANDAIVTVTAIQGPIYGSLPSYTRSILAASILGSASLVTADRTYFAVAGTGFTGKVDKIIVRN
jgi:hypothetical protein